MIFCLVFDLVEISVSVLGGKWMPLESQSTKIPEIVGKENKGENLSYVQTYFPHGL